MKWIVFFASRPSGTAIAIAQTDSAVSDEHVGELLLRDAWDGAWSFCIEPSIDSVRARLERGEPIGSLPGADTLYVPAARLERTASEKPS